MNKQLEQDLKRSFAPVRRRMRAFSKAVGKGDAFGVVGPTWMLIFSFAIFALVLIFSIGLKKALGKYP